MRQNERRGLSFPEIMVAVVVISLCVVPLLWVLNSSRTDTSKAINYLRAVELANEAIEWASVAPLYRKGYTNDTVRQIGGSLVTAVGSGFSPAPIDVTPSANGDWQAEGLLAPSLTYSEQYNSAFFFRTIDVQDVTGGIRQGFLRRVTVTVEWAEGKKPQHLDQPGGERNKKIVLTTLILDDKQLIY
ncbi:MAG: hypothetical protein GX442_03085 [Candidatus Riflebacteria bacterium]|nr:hypothetical protein [Candidatus Riflebacteria bacterium]